MSNELIRKGPLPTGEQEGRALKAPSTELTNTRVSRDFHLRMGSNDYCVEVVRRGQFYEGYVSQVLKGDAFQFVQGPGSGRWFGALSDVRRLPGSRAFGGNGDLTFQFDGLEILQAAPTYEQRELALFKAKDVRNDLPKDLPPIDPIAKHSLMLTSEIGDLYTSEDVPGTSDVVDTAKHRRRKNDDPDAEDVEFKDQS